MKGIQVKDIRGNDPAELTRTLQKLEQDLFQHKLKRNTNQLENTMLIRSARRDIARIKTVLTDLSRQGATGKAATTPKEK